jgi:hypothetical protein
MISAHPLSFLNPDLAEIVSKDDVNTIVKPLVLADYRCTKVYVRKRWMFQSIRKLTIVQTISKNFEIVVAELDRAASPSP